MKRKKIHPGDPVYVDSENRIFAKQKEGRIYVGQYSLENKKSLKEGKKVILK